MSMSALFMLSILLGQVSFTEAGSALRGQPVALDPKDVESSLLEELASNYRPSADKGKSHITNIEEALRPMYLSVPKEEGGTIGHTVARYMLHRFFAQRNGWFIRGLEPGSGAAPVVANGSSSAGNQTLQDLQEWVPTYLQGFLEQLQGGKGISLREVAIIAATLEDLIHKENLQHLDLAYEALELQPGSNLDQAQLREVLEVWMMIYFLGGKFKVRGHKKCMRAHAVFVKTLKDWEAVQEWIHGIQMEVSPAGADNMLNYTAASLVVEEAGRRYATYNTATCNNLRSGLLKIESVKAGRVRLNDFYKKGLKGVFDFNEKPEYLATLGALDNTDPNEPQVILANYASSRSNCLVTSSFYAICCQNQCEELMVELEQKIAAPTATPETILELVSGMSTDTVKGPRTLPDSLVHRLHSIAEANDGAVPLHGRLFAQWLHHSFPRECPYPHQSGSTSPQTPDEWRASTGQADAAHTTEELQVKVDGDVCSLKSCSTGSEAKEQHGLKENELPWDETEELLRPVWMTPQASTQSALPPAPIRRSLLRTYSPLAAIASLGIFAWKLTPKSKTAFNSDLMC